MPRRPSPPSTPTAPTAPRRRSAPSAADLQIRLEQLRAQSGRLPNGRAGTGRPAEAAARVNVDAPARRPSGRLRERPDPAEVRQQVARLRRTAEAGLQGRSVGRLSPPAAPPAAASSIPAASPLEAATAPARRRVAALGNQSGLHPLTDASANEALRQYDEQVKQAFDRIVPVLQRLSALQHEDDFVERARTLARRELGIELPLPILETAWVTQLDMRTLFAWCVFETYEQTSAAFFRDDPLRGQAGSPAAEAFNAFLLSCGFHLLDVTPCADGRLAHAVAFALRLPFSSVRRRPHAGALFDVENTVDRWVKTEHRRYREGEPNPAHADTRYLKVVLYHFSSLDPTHEGCAAHGSDDAAAAGCGLQRLRDFQQAVENSFCCGASVDLLLMGIDTDTDAIRVHVPGMDGSTHLDRWLDARQVYDATEHLGPDEARARIESLVRDAAASSPDPGMVRLIARLLEHNLSQIDYVRQFHQGHYADAGHAERFIGVGIGFKEIHLRNLTYFAYMDTVEEGAPDLDVGVKIFKGLNVSRGLPVPVVVRFDYNGKVPGARERAVRHARRVQAAIESRYAELFREGLLHALLTVRDKEQHAPAEAVGSTITFASAGGH